MAKLGKPSASKAERQQAISDSIDEQAKESQRLALEAAKANEKKADSEENAVLAEAAEIGESLSNNPEFEQALSTAINAKKEDQYKSIAMLQLMELILPAEKLDRLPWPGSTKMEAELDAAKLSPDKRPNILIYDKVTASGGRRGSESFYKTLVLHTKTGQQAAKIKAQHDETIMAAQKKETTPLEYATIDADAEDETSAINLMLSAVRTAAKIRIQLNKIKKLKNIHFQWVREGGDMVPRDQDTTIINAPGVGTVRKSTKVLWFKSDNSTAEPTRCSINTLLRWKISDEMMDKQQGRLVDDDHVLSLVSSPKMKLDRDEKTGKTRLVKPTVSSATPQTPTLSKARDVNSYTDTIANMNAIVSYQRGTDPAQEELRYRAFKNIVNGPDEDVWSAYKLYILLSSVFADSAQVDRARKFEEANKPRQDVA